MGLFSSLFKNSDDDTDIEDEELESEKEQLPSGIQKLAVGMQLNISLQSGKALLSGRLASYTPTSMTVERAPGQFSFATCSLGSTVYIRGYNNDTTPIELKGTVEESTRILFKVKDLRAVPRDENRNNFRLTLSTPVTLYYQEDEHMQNPEQCMLVNISVGGACVESEYIHGEGEVLRLKVQLEDYTPMTFLGEVIRVEEPSHGKFRYGFLFAQLNEQETNALTRVLFNVQVGNKKEHRRDDHRGSW